ncbi:hypothetical protein BDN71DRAFT_285936 [Pleurotus eryngii]|uniref:Uncharacterized protein n=1 Tax=Pleurotus eryngii TaxID=5323 RepID=A0A9P5ZMD9_PLEER|nr:hypothetical protein BDN71DRAFT_285936 [Pleurotus eryngii]
MTPPMHPELLRSTTYPRSLPTGQTQALVKMTTNLQKDTTANSCTRLIPVGALKGVQFMRTPDYVQAVSFVDQRLINIQTGDFGGELDPHGANLRGNPLGLLHHLVRQQQLVHAGD